MTTITLTKEYPMVKLKKPLIAVVIAAVLGAVSSLIWKNVLKTD